MQEFAPFAALAVALLAVVALLPDGVCLAL